MGFHVAQLNIGALRETLDHPEMAEFTEALGPVNELAEAAPGFVWRLTDEDGQSSSYVTLDAVEDPKIAFNYSVWEDVESLKDFMYKTDHVRYLRRRASWFESVDEAITVCWWTPIGHIPGLADAYQRLLDLREAGPSERGWPLTSPWPKPETQPATEHER